MEDVIKRIIQIEQEAAELGRETQEKMTAQKKEQAERLAQLRETLRDKSDFKIAALRQREMQEVEEIIQKEEALCQEKVQRLQKIAENKMQEWVEKLVASIIKE